MPDETGDISTVTKELREISNALYHLAADTFDNRKLLPGQGWRAAVVPDVNEPTKIRIRPVLGWEGDFGTYWPIILQWDDIGWSASSPAASPSWWGPLVIYVFHPDVEEVSEDEEFLKKLARKEVTKAQQEKKEFDERQETRPAAEPTTAASELKQEIPRPPLSLVHSRKHPEAISILQELRVRLGEPDLDVIKQFLKSAGLVGSFKNWKDRR